MSKLASRGHNLLTGNTKQIMKPDETGGRDCVHGFNMRAPSTKHIFSHNFSNGRRMRQTNPESTHEQIPHEVPQWLA